MAEAKPHPKPAKKPDDRVEVWGSTLKARRGKLKRTEFKARPSKLGIGAPKSKSGRRKLGGGGVTPEMRAEVFARAGGLCQANGLHHKDCPGLLEPGWGWNAHHVVPRSKGGADDVENLLALWTGGPLAAGCHARVHQNPALAKALGLLGQAVA